MLFSKRTDWPAEANVLSQTIDGLKGRGIDIIDMTQSNPTLCGFDYPPDWFGTLADVHNRTYQPDALGMMQARRQVADFTDFDPGRVVLTASTSESYSFLFRLLLNPGDKVLVPRPSYPLFQFLLGLNDAAYDYYPLVYAQDRWSIDFKALEQNIDERTKAIILVNPNNPTGSYITPEEIRKLNALCRTHGLAIISDEVFYEYPLMPHVQASLKNNPDVLTCVMGGLSKSAALPQMKVGWILTSGPDFQVKDAMGRLDIIADTFLSVNTPAQNALGLWLKQVEMIRSQILWRVQTNLEVLQKSGLKTRRVEGGWYAVIEIHGHDEDQIVLKLLNEHHVLVHPGYFFDFVDEGHLVVSLLPPLVQFAKMVQHLKGIL